MMESVGCPALIGNFVFSTIVTLRSTCIFNHNKNSNTLQKLIPHLTIYNCIRF